MVAPNDERRHVCGQVEAVCGADRLPARVDHGPHSTDEGTAAIAFRQPLVGAPHLHRLGVRETSPAEELDDRVPPVPHGCWEQCRHHVLGPWQGGETEDPVHLAAQAAGVNKYQALATLGELISKLQGHSTTEGLPDHGGSVDAEEVEEVPHGAGKVAERIVAGRFFGRPVPGEVRGQHRVVALQQAHGGDPRKRAAGDAVEQQQYWAMTTTAVADLVAVDGDVLYRKLFCWGGLLIHVGQPRGRPKGLPPSRRPTPCADRATSECVESPMIELASGKYLLQLSHLPSGLLGISRHLLGTTQEVDDRHH